MFFQQALQLPPKVLDAPLSQIKFPPNLDLRFGGPARFLSFLPSVLPEVCGDRLTPLSVGGQCVFITSSHSVESARPQGGEAQD